MIRAEPIRIPFSYAAGAAGSRFLVALRDERRLLGARCEPCDRVRCPPAAYCPDCGEDTTQGVEVGPEGELVSWTRVPGRGVFGLIRLDGADTALLHRLVGPTDGWRVGDRVRAAFAEARTGSVLDIEGFARTEAPTP